MSITSFPALSGASRSLSNLGTTAINTALLPDTHNSYDFGADAARWNDGFFGGQLTCYDLVVESGSSIQLAGATFENRGHYTSVDTNFGIKHDDSTTAFLAIYAENASVFTHANLLLDAQGSALNIIKNSPSHMFAPGMAGITNEDGNFGVFVGHDHEISFQHYESLVKDEYGNITNMTGMQSLMRLDNDHLQLEDIDLDILASSGNIAIHFRPDDFSFINDPHGLVVGSIIDPGDTGHMFRVDGGTYLNGGVEVHNDSGPHLQLTHNDTRYSTFTVNSNGDLRIDSYNNYGAIGIGKNPEYGIEFDVKGRLQADDINVGSLFVSDRFQGIFVFNSQDKDTDLITWQTGNEYGEIEYDYSANAIRIDHPLRLWQDHSDYGGVLWLDESNNAPTVAEGGKGHQLWTGNDHKLYWMDQTGNNTDLSGWTDWTVPLKIEQACYEIAYALLEGVDPQDQSEAQDVQRQAYGSVRTSYGYHRANTAQITHGVPSSVAWRMLKPFLTDGGVINGERV